MSQSLFNFIKVFFSIVFSGLAIKLLDDLIDLNNIDYVPYIMCFLCIAILLASDSSSLFFSSYIVGMFHDENLKLISRLKAYQEQIIVFIISILLTNYVSALWSLFIICTIQGVDDLIDRKADAFEGKKNWVLKYGAVEIIVVIIIFFILSIYLSPVKTLISIPVALLLSYIFNNSKNINKAGR